MPEGIEYLHCVQAALDPEGLRYQVLDTSGEVRERLSWPLVLPPLAQWRRLPFGEQAALLCERAGADRIVALRFTCRSAGDADGSAQTLLSAFEPGELGSLWIGLRGLEQRLTVIIGPEARRSPHYWLGPPMDPAARFDIVLVIHTGMGPGGVMVHTVGDGRLSSLHAASPWGAERLDWPSRWCIGHAQGGADDRQFRGAGLTVSATVT
jgi:hypothetical protein